MSEFSLDDVAVGFFVTGTSKTATGTVTITGKVTALETDETLPAVQVEGKDGACHWMPVETLTRVDRPLSLIAQDIYSDWKVLTGRATPPGAGALGGMAARHPAQPYVEAMSTLGSMEEMYGAEGAESIVQYFLVNASGWRGDVARHVKAELKGMVGLR